MDLGQGTAPMNSGREKHLSCAGRSRGLAAMILQAAA
jgi:hypothetical protein